MRRPEGRNVDPEAKVEGSMGREARKEVGQRMAEGVPREARAEETKQKDRRRGFEVRKCRRRAKASDSSARDGASAKKPKLNLVKAKEKRKETYSEWKAKARSEETSTKR